MDSRLPVPRGSGFRPVSSDDAIIRGRAIRCILSRTLPVQVALCQRDQRGGGKDSRDYILLGARRTTVVVCAEVTPHDRHRNGSPRATLMVPCAGI